MESFPWLSTFLLYVHVLGVVVWLGGMLFLVLVLNPVLRRAIEGPERYALLGAVARRFRDVGWLALGAIGVSGIAMLVRYTMGGLPLMQTRFGQVLLVKLALVGAIVGLSVLHDFFIGPRLVEYVGRLSTLPADSPERARVAGKMQSLRRQVILLAQLNLVLALIVVFLGLSLRRL